MFDDQNATFQRGNQDSETSYPSEISLSPGKRVSVNLEPCGLFISEINLWLYINLGMSHGRSCSDKSCVKRIMFSLFLRFTILLKEGDALNIFL